MNEMRCPFCVEAGMRSTLEADAWGTSTAMFVQSYYDYDGKFHRHDPNSHSQGYRCSYGHRWAQVSRDPCPAGDQEGESKIVREADLFATGKSTTGKPRGGETP